MFSAMRPTGGQQSEPLAPRPETCELRHFALHRDRHCYCGHPRQAIFRYFGDELIVGHNHAPCDYALPSDVRHGLPGYHRRAVVLLQRSRDDGASWPEHEETVVYDETMPTAQKRAFLYGGEGARAQMDMFAPDSVFFFGRTFLPEDREDVPVCFALRSADRGRSWEGTPTVIRHPDGEMLRVHKDCHPVVRMPDGRTLLAAMTIDKPGGPAIYRSCDHGLTWEFLARVAVDHTGEGRFTYAALLLMPGGQLQCFMLHIHHDHRSPSSRDEAVDGVRNAICRSVSDDGGLTWGEPTAIVGKGGACWRSPGERGRVYRSPWPMLLDDGRILVVFARRRMPMGIGGVVSSDGGNTWSHEFVIRDDADCEDLGYPVGCQLQDGRIFIAYYYTLPDGNAFGGTRFIAGSTFLIR